MSKDFNYSRVLAFLRVAELKSFSRAAEELHISISMVSVHVRELERSLGTALLVRTTRSISLTETGKKFYDEFFEITRKIHSLLEEFKGESEACDGVLRVASPRDYGARFMVPMIAELFEAIP